jgi:RHS repeat-associated protein
MANVERKQTAAEFEYAPNNCCCIRRHGNGGAVWAYSPDGRWIERIAATNDGSTYYPSWTNRYVWDGQVLLAILDHTNGLVISFVRGLDLSGTIQGAGGVGGVLAVTFKTNGTHFVCYDGNGNVTALTDASTGANSAVFEYGPFGEPLRVTGPAAGMPLRFSTMYEDDVTGDRKYLFREYRPSLGRWLSRDPIEEGGGLNSYAACGNAHVDKIDKDGRMAVEGCPPRANEVLKTAFSEACRRIKSSDFGCCTVGSALGRDYQSRLGYLCDRDFKVKCTLEHQSPRGGVARALPNEGTILIYNAFFSQDAAGWGSHTCIMAHEMLHLLGPLHPQADRLFNRLHQCLGCPRYRDFSDWEG